MPARRMMQPAFDYDALTGEIQHTLAAIADIEFTFQSACERLEGSPEPEAGKARRLAELERVRQERRAPCTRRLAELYEHARTLIGAPSEPARDSGRERRFRVVAPLPHH